jgi:predicted unusual protein kinase regulating ubiquinone biosynthesis (AarF/ABC1/UbiB family)
MAPNLVDQVFREEFGRPPAKLFKRFEGRPFAAASIGQVHRATALDGRDLAVKVQYPGVRQAIAADLANAGWLVGAAGMLARGVDTQVLIRDLKSGILAELDYCREATNQARFGQIYEGHGFIRIPRVYPDLSSERVLVQEYLHGAPLRSALALDQAERNRISEMLMRYTFGNFYRHHLFNGDPHPGNYLLLEDGTLGCLDFGCVADFPAAVVGQFCTILDALFRGDHDAWRRATEDVGILRPDAPFTTSQLYEHMHWFWKPVLEPHLRFTRELAAEMIRRNTMANGEGGAINKHLDIPEGMVFLTRINFGLAGVLASLEGEGPWQGIIREYIYDEPPSTELGRLSAATSAWPPV